MFLPIDPIFVNHFTDNLGNLARLFADDTSLSYSGQNFDLMQIEINNYFTQMFMIINKLN
jgi:hypothetical protein